MKIKYIIVDNTHPILLSGVMNHSDFSEFNITSAGFCSINEQDDGFIEVNVFGSSTSLNMDSHAEDANIIALLFL